jgi:hypothetical protein
VHASVSIVGPAILVLYVKLHGDIGEATYMILARAQQETVDSSSSFLGCVAHEAISYTPDLFRQMKSPGQSDSDLQPERILFVLVPVPHVRFLHVSDQQTRRQETDGENTVSRVII